ncbi:hypothetical protein DL794_25655 [Escherichia coli]|nr:hypothetical protein DL794_25655 [Escherichia coli]
MLKVDAITFFGSKTKLANAAGVRLASVAAWGILVPEGRAMRLQEASGGELLYDPKVYDEYRKALGVNRVKIFERWKAIDTRDKREKFTALVPAIMEAIRINDFRLYREISDGKSITYMIAGLNKEYGDVVESGLLFADPAVVDRETDELIEKAIAFKLAYRQQYQQKAGWNYEPSFC